MAKHYEILKNIFGYDSFRDAQEELVVAASSGSDVLAIMPTGAGKSLCYQIPALMLDGISIVISPLISLMQDQVIMLNKLGVTSTFINSSLSFQEIRQELDLAAMDYYKIIYVAPERLLNGEFIRFAKNTKISMVTIDEAHCISQWGQDFRPSYMQIPDFISVLPKRPVVCAYTATATTRVKDDIKNLLKLQNPKVVVTGFNRENLHFAVSNPKDKTDALKKFINENKGQYGIVYCLTRKAVEKVYSELLLDGFNVSKYHAGLTDKERFKNQQDFIYDKVQIMVATNAFGMGIDKSNISFVVHYNMPKDIESYYQEAGRAGRDGSQARCMLFYSGQDVRTIKWMIENTKESEPDSELLEAEQERLKQMTFYSTTTDCLRGFILKYFGENPPQFCGDCSNCLSNFEKIDITIDAQKILSCVYRVTEQFGTTMIIDILKGSKNQRVLELGFDKLSTYGICDNSVTQLRSIINFLIQQELLEQTDNEFPILKLTKKSWEFLRAKPILTMDAPKEEPKTDFRLLKTKDKIAEQTPGLFEALCELRNKIAKEENVPPYIIFSNRTLQDMCVKLPRTISDFKNISGVGEVKCANYGDIFISKVTQYCKNKVLNA